MQDFLVIIILIGAIVYLAYRLQKAFRKKKCGEKGGCDCK